MIGNRVETKGRRFLQAGPILRAVNFIADGLAEEFPGAKNAFSEPFVYIKTMILPRQAGDKHEQTLKQEAFFDSAAVAIDLLAYSWAQNAPIKVKKR